MSTTNELHVVLGGNGGIGHAVVRELVAQGKRVRAVNRSGRISELPASVEVVAADLLDLGEARRASQGANVIYHCAGLPYDRWAKDFPPMMENVIEATHEAGAKLVFADNCYMYAPTALPITENLPYAPTTSKGRVRKHLAEMLMNAYTKGKVRATIGRATGFYGPGVRVSTMGEQFFPGILAGKGGQWLGPLDLPHAMTFVDDFARGLITLAQDDAALGQVWHMPTAEPLTGRQYITLICELAGVPVKASAVPSLILQVMGIFNPTLRELVEMLYEFKEPYLMDGSKYLRAFGGAPTPHRDALEKTVAWYRQQVPQMAHTR